MRALGIDPGTALCGYGIIDKDGPSLRVLDYGVIETFPSMGMDERLEIVFTGLNQLLEEYRPQIVGVEESFLTGYYNGHYGCTGQGSDSAGGAPGRCSDL